MKVILILCVTLALQASESNPRIARIMQTYGVAVGNADQTKEQAIAAAEERHQQEVSRANNIAVRGLKRLVSSRSTPVEQVEIYRSILKIDREDEDAVRFFTAIGTLENVLAELDTVTDMFGNPIANNITLNIQSFIINNTWTEANRITYNFHSDGKFSSNGNWRPVSWSVNGDEITVQFIETTRTGRLNESNDKIIFNDGIIYVKN